MGPTDLVSDKDFESVIVLDSLGVVYFTKAILEKQLSRGHKSALLTTSSLAANLSMPGVATYCGSKALVSKFSEALSFEVRD